jgi:hypothetical protein
MEKEELIKEWALKLTQKLDSSSDQNYDACKEVLTQVFDVGAETGRDTEKLERQLQKLGTPQGYSNVG